MTWLTSAWWTWVTFWEKCKQESCAVVSRLWWWVGSSVSLQCLMESCHKFLIAWFWNEKHQPTDAKDSMDWIVEVNSGGNADDQPESGSMNECLMRKSKTTKAQLGLKSSVATRSFTWNQDRATTPHLYLNHSWILVFLKPPQLHLLEPSPDLKAGGRTSALLHPQLWAGNPEEAPNQRQTDTLQTPPLHCCRCSWKTHLRVNYGIWWSVFHRMKILQCLGHCLCVVLQVTSGHSKRTVEIRPVFSCLEDTICAISTWNK